MISSSRSLPRLDRATLVLTFADGQKMVVALQGSSATTTEVDIHPIEDLDEFMEQIRLQQVTTSNAQEYRARFSFDQIKSYTLRYHDASPVVGEEPEAPKEVTQ